MLINMQIRSLTALCLCYLAAFSEYEFFTAIHNLVGTGIGRIGMFHYIIRVEVIFQIGVRQGIRIQCIDISCLAEGICPAVIRVLIHLCFHTVSLFFDMFL